MELLVPDDGYSRLEQYKSLVQTAFTIMANPNRKWIKNKTSTDGFLKTECLLECDSNRFFTVCSDRYYETRSLWDKTAKKLQVFEKFETEDGIIHFIQQNDFIGIQWIREPRLIVYRTLSHPKHTYKGPVQMMGIWIRSVDKTKTFLTIVSNYTHTMNITEMEVLVNNTPKFLTIYNPWKCKACTKMVPAHELECRGCRTPRFWRCQSLECYEPQMEHAKKCSFCGIKKHC